jgi:predicted hotdog family 3-hydroxylacyl-ACP dehydratase
MHDNLTLPMPAAGLIPHRPPMLLVDRLISFDSGSGIVEACLDSGSILVDSTGRLDKVALVEILAQGYATIKGYDDLINGKPVQEGFLVGIRKLKLSGEAFAGERLSISIKTVGSFEGFAVVEGEIRRADEIIASGSLKLWLVNEGARDGK